MKDSAFTLYNVTARERRILLQLRTDDAPRYPGKWGFFGGGVEPGESFRQAVDREAREELQISLLNPKMLGTFRVEERQIALYVAPFDQCAGLLYLQKHQREGKDLGLFTFEEIRALDTTPCVAILIKAIEEWFGSSSESWHTSFLEHIVKTKSQYDASCRALAAEVLEYRRRRSK